MAKHKEKELWSARERLAFIERCLWWHGTVYRGDMMRVFGISPAQASVDIQLYLKLNPEATTYNLSSKRYEANPEMECVVIRPSIDEVLGAKGPDIAPWSGQATVSIFQTPVREGVAQAQRRVHIAAVKGLRVGIRYWSATAASGVETREIAPQAFFWDGWRWQVRAWCFKNEDFRDFVLSRIERAEWPQEPFTPDEADPAWSAIEELEYRAHSSLDEKQAAEVERDYGMSRGRLRIKVRKVMADYVRAWLSRSPDLQEASAVAAPKAAVAPKAAAKRGKDGK